jgi:hypothetical protein
VILDVPVPACGAMASLYVTVTVMSHSNEAPGCPVPALDIARRHGDHIPTKKKHGYSFDIQTFTP